ncbi:MAG: alpha/beta hydrolase [Burkholderiaceae bacterium]
MSFDWQRFDGALRAALAVPQLRADATRCNASIELVATGPPNDKRVLLWPGAGDAAMITLQAGVAVWSEVFAPLPAPGYQSLGALRRQCPGFAVLGSELTVAQALPFIEALLENLRWHLNGAPEQGPPDHSGLAHIKGSYLRLSPSAHDWVYAERAGLEQGPPLLMLHTAGADSRQWHGLMGLAPLREIWSLHTFDLPGHGRSPLPQGQVNWDWRLTESLYLKWVIGYMDAAGLDRVTLMGCSMGSAIGLALLAKFAHRIAGAVLLEAPYRSPGRRSKYLNHPEVHGARLGAAWVGSLLAPASPKAGRDSATWIYSQAAPGVYDGDLAYYSDDFDAHEHTAQIDARHTPLWLLTGSYDYSATPDDSRRVASEIAGAHFVELPGFGHFPMVENPTGLLPYLMQPLSELRAAISSQAIPRTEEHS